MRKAVILCMLFPMSFTTLARKRQPPPAGDCLLPFLHVLSAGGPASC